MTPTSILPAVSGWYWMYDGSARAIARVDIDVFDGYSEKWVWQIGSSKPTPLKKLSGMLWAGPIKEPS